MCCTDKCVSFVKFHWVMHLLLLHDSLSKKVKSPKMWAEKMAFIGCIWPAASCVLRMKYADPEVVASCFSKVLPHPGILFSMGSRGSYSQIGGREIGVGILVPESFGGVWTSGILWVLVQPVLIYPLAPRSCDPNVNCPQWIGYMSHPDSPTVSPGGKLRPM